jgi:hypothetical protein
MKIDALLTLLDHHLARDDQPPLHWMRTQPIDASEAQEAGGYWAEDLSTKGLLPPPSADPDKIVVFSNFTSHHSFLEMVC